MVVHARQDQRQDSLDVGGCAGQPYEFQVEHHYGRIGRIAGDVAETCQEAYGDWNNGTKSVLLVVDEDVDRRMRK